MAGAGTVYGGAGGDGGGGAGGDSPNGDNPGNVGNPGTANTGGGGGGGGNTNTGGKGGSGVVIIRYLTSDFGTCTGGTKTTDGNYTVHKFLLADTGTDLVMTQAIIATTNYLKKFRRLSFQ
jgi:hypothetical protein